MTGQRVGNWVLGETIGRGPIGVVYRAHALDDPDRTSAVKLLTHEAARSPDFLARFPAEMLALHRLNHPNIISFYDAGVTAGQAWYATEFVVGTDLATILKTQPRKPSEPGLGWASEVISLGVQAARALKHGHHRSILHRDLKPANVLLTPDGVVKIADFGVAKVLNLPPLSLPADPFGTAGHLAPEYFTGKQITRRSDLYALGGVLYAAVTGRPLFAAGTAAEFLHKHCYTLPDRPTHFLPDLPTDLDDLICSLLMKDPARRPASTAAVLEALDVLRGRAERRGKKVTWPPDPGDTSATQPALSHSDTGSDLVDSRPRPLMSRPAVVVPLFLFVVALALFLVFRPRPSADELYAAAEPLMASNDPAQWNIAWDKYLAPLAAYYPSEYQAEVAAARAKIDDRAALRRAIVQGRLAQPGSEAERLYHRGLALAQAGDSHGARQTWEYLVTAFAGVPEEERWVELAGAAVRELTRVSAPMIHSPPTAALDRARAMKAAGKSADASAILDALATLYRDDPATLELVHAAR